MRPKVIEKDRLKVDEPSGNAARLSYEMVFVDKEDVDEDKAILVEKLNTEWEHRLLKERQKSVDQGYAAGLEDGKKKAKAEIDQHLGTFEQAIHDLDQHLNETLEALKPGLHAMVFDLAEKVIGVPVSSEELQDKVKNQIEQFLKELADDSKAAITVSDHDFDSIQFLKEKITHLRQIEIERDPNLQPGEYRVDANHGVLLNNFKKILADFRSSTKIPDWGME